MALALLALTAPLTGCGRLTGALTGTSELDAAGLQEQLGGVTPPLVIDLRDRESYRAGHIPGAVSLRMEELAGFLSRFGPPHDRGVVVVCYRGNLSRLGAATVSGHGYREVRSLAGGTEGWRARGLPLEAGPGRALDPQLLRPPVARTSLLVQLALVGSGFGLKPAYMLLSFVLIVWLRRQRARDLRLIRWGLIAFLAGECVCAINYAIGETDALDLVHGLGMLVMGALMPWGLFRLLDDRVLHLSDPQARCTVQRLCGRCWKKEQVSCGLQRLFLLVAPALALVALMPLSGRLHRIDLLLPTFGTDVHWFKGVPAQLVEFRLFPLLAVGLFLWTTLSLLLGGKAALERAQLPFFAGFGVLSYSLLRFFLFAAYERMPAWANWWEEVTETIAIVGVGVLLWVFRRQLELVGAAPAPAAPEPAEEPAAPSPGAP